MNELENQVKEALIMLCAEENLEILQQPEFIDKFKQFAKELSTSMVEALDELDDEDEDDEDEDFAEFMYEEMVNVISNPEQIKEIAYQNARSAYLTKIEAKAFLDGYVEGKDLGQHFERKKIEEMKKAHQELIDNCHEFYEFNEELVKQLVNLAEKVGIQKATTLETRNKVIKQLIPTEEKYMVMVETNSDATKLYFNRIQEIVSIDEEEEVDRYSKAIFDGMQKAITALSQDLVKELARKIYN